MLTTVLFDMDGTLFDSERLYRDAWLKVGVPLTVYQSFVGTPIHHIKAVLQDELHMDPDRALAEKIKLVDEKILKDGIDEKPGMEECLHYLLSHGYRTAICTSSGMEVAKRYLAITHTQDLFDLVFSGRDLKNGKPAPDIWLTVAEKLHATPERCVVVEDSWNGVRSGHAAGMITVMIPDMQPVTDEMREKANVILKSLSDLPAYLESIQEQTAGDSSFRSASRNV